MKLEQTIWVVCDANGECKGLFSTKELANAAADYYGAFVSEYDTVFEELPGECRSALTPKVLTGFVII